MNDPNLDAALVTLPDGWTGKLLEVDDRGEPMSWAPGVTYNNVQRRMLRWYPQADGEAHARKLYKRVWWGGHVLVTLTAITYAVLMEMYTTTSNDSKKYRRVRLQYRTSPVADFGIAKGSIKVGPEDCLAFKKRSDGSVTHGQDPREHYWLWFKTIRGEEVTLDMSMFTFNFNTMVHLKGHIPLEDEGKYDFAPAFFEAREIRREVRKAPAKMQVHEETSRVSVLKSEDLAETIAHSHDHRNVYPEDVECFRKFMSRISGGQVSIKQARMAYDLAHTLLHDELEKNLQKRAWAKAPIEPNVEFYKF